MLHNDMQQGMKIEIQRTKKPNKYGLINDCGL